MSASDAAAVVAELRAAFAAGDPDRIQAVLHPDFEIEQPASLPHGGTFRGASGLGEMGARFAQHWDRSIDGLVDWDCGDTVVQLTTQTWVSRATGRAATVDVVELLTVAEDRIRSIRVFQQDTHLLLATLDT